MRFKILILVMILAVGGAYAIYDQLRTPSGPPVTIAPVLDESENKVLAPNPTFAALDGTLHRLHDFEGKVIILNFWASWCPPCVAEFPQLLELAGMKRERAVLIALSVDDSVADITTFLERYALDISPENVIIAHDPGKVISQDMFQTTLYPETYIIGPDLRIEKKVAGVINWTGPKIISFIEEL